MPLWKMKYFEQKGGDTVFQIPSKFLNPDRTYILFQFFRPAYATENKIHNRISCTDFSVTKSHIGGTQSLLRNFLKFSNFQKLGLNLKIFKNSLCHRNQRKILARIWPFLFSKICVILVLSHSLISHFIKIKNH